MINFFEIRALSEHLRGLRRNINVNFIGIYHFSLEKCVARWYTVLWIKMGHILPAKERKGIFYELQQENH
mgnify:CR=1 FL=1